MLKSNAGILKVLLVEDDPAYAHLIAGMLKRFRDWANCELTHASCLDTAIRFADKGKFDVILLDLGLPDSLGMETFRKMYLHVSSRSVVPIVVLTGYQDDALGLSLIRAGAQDYLIKGEFDKSMLMRSMRYAIERRVQEKKHSLSEEKYTFLLKHLHFIAWEYDPGASRFTFVTGDVEGILGYPREQWFEQGFWIDHLHGDDREQAVKCRSSLSQTAEEDYQLEYRMKHANGKDIWVQELLHIVGSGSDSVGLTTGVLFDVTERKVVEEQLRKLSSAVEQTGDLIIITDRDGTIEYVNPAFSITTGYSPAEAVGRSAGILNSGVHDKAFFKRLWSTITGGGVWRGTVINRQKDGDLYTAQQCITPIRNKHGEITHYVDIQHDITEEKRIGAQLQQAQKMEAIGTLAGGIAHDFNNILAGMMGNLYLARKQVEHLPDVGDKLMRVEKLGHRGAEIIRQMLTFARKSTSQLQLFMLTPFMKEAVKLARVSIPENIDFRSSFCDDLLSIRGDATQIQQVFMNLLSNARDALADEENPVIRVKLHRCDADRAFRHRFPKQKGVAGFAHLMVEDNGCGIQENMQERVLEPFFTTKEVGRGTGLGLSMSYGAIKSHGGILDIESVPGCTVIHVYFPLVEETCAADAVEAGEKELSGGHGETILLADDSEHVRTACRDVLEHLGYRVMTACNGQEAVDVFERNRPEIVLAILDVVMPGLSGPAAAKEIRRLCPEVPVIFVTGYDKREAMQREENPAHSLILDKPVPVERLSRAVRSLLDRRESSHDKG